MRITPVPLNNSDLIRRASANGFTLSEAWHPPRQIPMHAHVALSVTILLEGSFEENYEPIHKSQSCQTGSVLIRPAGEFHADHLGLRGAHNLAIELDPQRVELCGKALTPLLSLAQHREGVFLDLALAMSQELRRTDNAASLTLESLSLELLARLVRVCESGETGPAPKWLKRVRDSIHDRFREQTLRISNLAAENSVHPVHLARVFREFYRMTPGNYVRRLRLEWARRQVMHTEQPLTSIALDCGFADQSHFARAFRLRYGIAPGRMRRITISRSSANGDQLENKFRLGA